LGKGLGLDGINWKRLKVADDFTEKIEREIGFSAVRE